jgi:hypothetical protein
MWRGAQHIAVHAADAVVAAHGNNYLHMQGLLRLAWRRTPRGERRALRLGQRGRRSAGSLSLAWARHRPPPYATDATPPCRAWVPLLTVDPYTSLGAFNDLQLMESSLPGLGGLKQAGALMTMA